MIVEENNIIGNDSSEINMKEPIIFDKKRNNYIDQVKGILIFAVVFGHLTSGVVLDAEFDILGYTRFLIYAVHMPMFIFISGLFSKSKMSIDKIFRNLIIPYLIFDSIWIIPQLFLGGTINKPIWIVPEYVYWYILCVALLRFIISYVKNDKIFFAFCLLFTFITPNFPESTWRILTWGRVVLLFPVFWLGFKMNVDWISYLRTRSFFIKGIIIFAGVLTIIIELILRDYNFIGLSFATHNQPSSMEDCLFKFAFCVFSIIQFLSLTIVFRGKSKTIARWGSNSLIIYLLHPYLVYIFRKILLLLDNKLFINDYVLFIMFVSFAFLITELLSLSFLRKIYDKSMNNISALCDKFM